MNECKRAKIKITKIRCENIAMKRIGCPHIDTCISFGENFISFCDSAILFLTFARKDILKEKVTRQRRIYMYPYEIPFYAARRT